ncbi:DUF420 domain-containing protein [Aureibacter tunicatorum]|uniref:Membrane protein n=1 Tax=Aureibacter tunicatorum TaxID=866807 RepID=A0AAE4BRS7_9BACT|nr:DUF420 domain-containing protein [Aureibacter tunicatorum]MDR6238991.1 putative membrane protein [Aureibacter tunicatorum]BDD05083.1 putative membrane protein YozB [Aureibacter tunicatorum]
MSSIELSNKQSFWAIGIISALVPVLVAVLLFVPAKLNIASDWVHILPSFHALVNGTTAVILVLALYFVKQGNFEAHKKSMLVAFVLGGMFLISYVVYHSSVESTKFGDINGDRIVDSAELAQIGAMRYVYLGVLLSHICFAAIVLPLVLMSYYFGLKGLNEKHKKLVRFAYPIWLYVSVTGVVVYMMLKPYYQF